VVVIQLTDINKSWEQYWPYHGKFCRSRGYRPCPRERSHAPCNPRAFGRFWNLL